MLAATLPLSINRKDHLRKALLTTLVGWHRSIDFYLRGAGTKPTQPSDLTAVLTMSTNFYDYPYAVGDASSRRREKSAGKCASRRRGGAKTTHFLCLPAPPTPPPHPTSVVQRRPVSIMTQQPPTHKRVRTTATAPVALRHAPMVRLSHAQITNIPSRQSAAMSRPPAS